MTSNTIIKRAYADTPEGQVHLRRAGEGDPLVLMHWCPSNGRQYEPVMPGFAARGYSVYAPDLMGYGNSDKPDRQWAIADFATNLGHVLDALDLEAVDLVGGHTSAAVCAEFAVEHPDRIKRLVLDGCPARPTEVRAERKGTYALPLKLTADGEHMMWAWKRSFRRPDMPLDRAFLSAVDLLKAGFTWHTGYDASSDYDMESRLPELRVPTLVMSAPEDPLNEYFEKCVSLIPDSRSHLFQGRGLADPAQANEFVQVVADFLSTAEPKAGGTKA